MSFSGLSGGVPDPYPLPSLRQDSTAGDAVPPRTKDGLQGLDVILTNHPPPLP